MNINSGKEPYIFISYAHRDSEIVLATIEKMEAEGFRIWYDSGIEAGTEWPQYIAEQLAGASCVMIFMSPNSAESHNCRNEINLAHELKKELFVVHLEDFEMPLGLRLQLNLSQAIFRPRFKQDSDFIAEVIKARIIQPYRNQPVEVPETPPQAVLISHGVAAVPMPISVEKEEISVAPVTLDKLPKQTPKKKEKPIAQKHTEKKPKKSSRFFAKAGIVLAAIVVLCVALRLLTTVPIGGERVRKNETYLYFHDVDLSGDDMQKISQLKHLTHLTCENTTLTSLELLPLRRMTTLKSLSLSENTLLKDISTLSDLTNLQSLDISYTAVEDITPLSGLSKLSSLDISGTAVTRASVESYFPNLYSLYMNDLAQLDVSTITVPESLEVFSCSNSGLTDIAFLQNCTNLERVIINGNQVASIDVLSEKPLRELDADNNNIAYLFGLENSYELTTLDLSNNSIVNLSPLSECFRISQLNLSNNRISDLSPLATIDNLTILDLSYNKISDISPLATIETLTTLNLSFNGINDLSPLAENKNFVEAAQVLDLQSNQIVDVAPLSAFRNCTTMYLQNNQIVDINVLANCSMMTTLDVTGNQISSLNYAPPALQKLFAAGNPITNIQNLKLTGDYTTLSIQYTEQIDWAAIKDRFYDIQVYDIPPREEDPMSALGYRIDYKSEPVEAEGSDLDFTVIDVDLIETGRIDFPSP